MHPVHCLLVLMATTRPVSAATFSSFGKPTQVPSSQSKFGVDCVELDDFRFGKEQATGGV